MSNPIKDALKTLFEAEDHIADALEDQIRALGVGIGSNPANQGQASDENKGT